MTLENDTSTAAARRRQRIKSRTALDPKQALEAMLLNAHRVAVTLGELSIFQDGELSVAEWAILKSLDNRQSVPLKEIGAAAGVSRQRIRKLVSELELKRLVSTSKSEADDKRLRVISATPLAAKVLSLISLQMQDLLPEAGDSKRGNQFARAARSLEKVAKAMRRKWRKKRAETKKAEPDIDLDDDDED